MSYLVDDAIRAYPFRVPIDNSDRLVDGLVSLYEWGVDVLVPRLATSHQGTTYQHNTGVLIQHLRHSRTRRSRVDHLLFANEEEAALFRITS